MYYLLHQPLIRKTVTAVSKPSTRNYQLRRHQMKEFHHRTHHLHSPVRKDRMLQLYMHLIVPMRPTIAAGLVVAVVL